MAIFRLLSPDEIDKYIVDEKVRKIGESMPMAANGEPMQFDDERPHLENQQKKSFPKDHQAEIIPISKDLEQNSKITSDVSEEVDESQISVQKKLKKQKASPHG